MEFLSELERGGILPVLAVLLGGIALTALVIIISAIVMHKTRHRNRRRNVEGYWLRFSGITLLTFIILFPVALNIFVKA